MLPEESLKSAAVNDATPLVAPSAAALTPVTVRPLPMMLCPAVAVMPLLPETVPVATVDWMPLLPIKATPAVRLGKKTLLLNVDDAVEKSPLAKPMTVEVEL